MSFIKICTICVAKTKALISFAVTVKLICVFVFAYAKRGFSHAAAQMYDQTVWMPRIICICYVYLRSFSGRLEGCRRGKHPARSGENPALILKMEIHPPLLAFQK